MARLADGHEVVERVHPAIAAGEYMVGVQVVAAAAEDAMRAARYLLAQRTPAGVLADQRLVEPAALRGGGHGARVARAPAESRASGTNGYQRRLVALSPLSAAARAKEKAPL
jgi:hypothetical protein